MRALILKPSAVVAALVMAACAAGPGESGERASRDPSGSGSTPSAVASVAPADVRAAFLARVQDPAVTYHVDTSLEVVFAETDWEATVSRSSTLDVSGVDYVGTETTSTVMTGEAATSGTMDLLSVDGTAYVGTNGGGWLRADEAAASGRQVNPFLELEPSHLTFLGHTADGLYEFDIRVWLGNDPTKFEFDMDEEAWASGWRLGSYQTRVTVDATGVPHDLTVTFAMSFFADEIPGNGRWVERYSRFGEDITIESPDDA